MKILRFLTMIISRGSLFLEPRSFKEEQLRIIDASNISGSAAPRIDTKGFKSQLLRTSIGYSLLANLAYFKKCPHHEQNVIGFGYSSGGVHTNFKSGKYLCAKSISSLSG